MRKINKLLLVFLCLCLTLPVVAQQVDTVEVYSSKMSKKIKNVVILPADYDKAKKYPVVYLLHGYGGRYDTWLNKTKTNLPQAATRMGLIFVCPNGENAWYWDSPVNPKSQFDTYVSTELVTYVDKNYSTIASPKGRAITGYSMGGHGGLWLGINHQDVYGACGSMSGGVDIRPYPGKWEITKLLGSYNKNMKIWDDYTVMNQLHKIEPTLAIIIDCGKDDFFYQINETLHDALLYRNIEHDYIIRPGGHKHDYWDNAVDYQLLFFSKYFEKK